MSQAFASTLARFTSLATVMLAGMLPLAATAQGKGLSVSEQAWWGPRLQARVGINAALGVDGHSTAWQQQAGIVMGDYYFSRIRLGTNDVSSGFRATSGLLLGQRSMALGTPALSVGKAWSLTMTRHTRPAMSGAETSSDGWAAMPYLGLGWSGASMRGGWGVSADFGFAGRNASGLRAGTTQGLDELLRDLRLMPVLQLGASYTF